MSIQKQIEAILQQKSLFREIVKPHVPTQNARGDIKDGEFGDLYQKFSSEVLERNRQESVLTVRFALNTDGVRVYKSNHYDIWPIYLAILELSEFERYQPQNLIMAALWHGPKKPSIIQFAQPFLRRCTQE